MRILNLGAGVQSTTVALMGIRNWEYWHCTEPLPYEPVGLIDYAIFADTQEEPRAVYAHLEWLKTQCEKFFPILVRTVGSIGADLMRGENSTGGRFASIPAYTTEVEGTMSGITKRQCTKEYKVDVIWRTIRREIFGLEARQRIPVGTELHQIFGLSYDELGRIARVKAIEAEKPVTTHFPLFELEMTRGSCKTWLKKNYPEREVPRSACVFCPYKSNREWAALKENDAEGWARAIEIDEALRKPGLIVNRNMREKLYVHRSCVPLVKADLDDSETRDRKRGQEMFSFLAECEGMCGV